MKDENTPLIKYSNLFNKQRKALPLEIKIAFRDARELFLDNPSHSALRNHPLREKFAGYRSIDVTEDYRVLFKEIKAEKQIVIKFYTIGTHEELYGK